MLVMLGRQAIEGQRAADVLLDPIGELRILALPAGEPRREIMLSLRQVATCVEPAQLLQAVVIGLARQIIERVTQEVNIAALPCRLRQDLSDCLAKAAV